MFLEHIHRFSWCQTLLKGLGQVLNGFLDSAGPGALIGDLVGHVLVDVVVAHIG